MCAQDDLASKYQNIFQGGDAHRDATSRSGGRENFRLRLCVLLALLSLTELRSLRNRALSIIHNFNPRLVLRNLMQNQIEEFLSLVLYFSQVLQRQAPAQTWKKMDSYWNKQQIEDLF